MKKIFLICFFSLFLNNCCGEDLFEVCAGYTLFPSKNYEFLSSIKEDTLNMNDNITFKYSAASFTQLTSRPPCGSTSNCMEFSLSLYYIKSNKLIKGGDLSKNYSKEYPKINKIFILDSTNKGIIEVLYNKFPPASDYTHGKFYIKSLIKLENKLSVVIEVEDDNKKIHFLKDVDFLKFSREY
ncbi:MAG: hypothetical protein U0457_07235 [Candidatus Sericytochromatia bacterium]